MTKPANFPERKRQRQIKALDRLTPRAGSGMERAALEEAIEAGSQRGVRTKKDRSANAKFVRA